MHKGSCRDECVALAAFVGHMQAGAALCHGSIDSQRALCELRQHVLLQLGPQQHSLGGVFSLNG